MPANPYSPQCYIKIGSSQVSEDFMKDLIEVVVDSSLHLPSMFTIQLNDPELEWADNALLDIGKEVEITFEQGSAYALAPAKGTVIVGEITSLEPDFSAEGKTTMMVRGYDKSHRLHRGRQTRTFQNQKDSGIAQTVAGESELGTDVDATSVTHDWVLQNNQTNMEFLMTLAERVGYQVYVADDKLCFKKGDATRGDGPTLTLGDNLRRFRPRFAATHQADKVVVKGWDGKGKVAIESTATQPGGLNQGGMTETGGDIAKVFGAAEAVVTDHPVFTSDEANALATGLSQDVARDFVEAEGECGGHPQVLAGYDITIEGVGRRFGGKYFVTSATHVYEGGKYKTTFTISGRQPNTLSHLLASDNGRGASQGTVQGVVTAEVTNLEDPDDLGRVKVVYSWLGAIESFWARIAAPSAGDERGFMYLPEVGDEVLVAFEHGDPRRPYILGQLWNSKDKPPKPNSEVTSGGKVNERIIKSRSGHVIILDDTDGSEQIIVRDKTEANEIVITSSDNNMSIKCDGDLLLEAKGMVTINSGGNMALEAKQGSNVEVKAGGNLTTKATGNLTAEASGNASVKGIQLALEGTAKSELKAPMVSVNGSGMTEVKGGLVKIN